MTRVSTSLPGDYTELFRSFYFRSDLSREFKCSNRGHYKNTFCRRSLLSCHYQCMRRSFQSELCTGRACRIHDTSNPILRQHECRLRRSCISLVISRTHTPMRYNQLLYICRTSCTKRVQCDIHYQRTIGFRNSNYNYQHPGIHKINLKLLWSLCTNRSIRFSRKYFQFYIFKPR